MSTNTLTSLITTTILITLIVIIAPIIDAQQQQQQQQSSTTTVKLDNHKNASSSQLVGVDIGIDIEKYIANLTNRLPPQGYNKNIRPLYGEKALLVNVTMHIDGISPISETSMEFRLDLYFGLNWNDHRLSYAIQHNITNVILEPSFAQKLWIPDAFFLGAKETKFHKSIGGESASGLELESNGDVHFSARITLVIQCSIDLTFFPMDQQKCSIQISSYEHHLYDMIYKWIVRKNRSPVLIYGDVQEKMPTFHLVGLTTFDAKDHFATGDFTRVQCDIYLARSIGYYVSQVYVPAFLIVVISWVPFWLDQDDHHARVALGVTTVLTMTTLVTNSEFPQSSNLKAIDIYLFVCFIMVFFSLFEYATVGYFERIRKRYREKQQQQQQQQRQAEVDTEALLSQKNPQDKTANGSGGDGSTVMIPMENNDDDPNHHHHRQQDVQCTNEDDKCSSSSKPRLIISFIINDVSLIDKWARRVFPLMFWLFNILYVVILLLLVRIYQKIPKTNE